MATRKSRKGEGGNLRRSEVMTLRFDPRTRYLMELASRVQRRTVSSFVDWAVAEMLKKIQVGTKQIQVEVPQIPDSLPMGVMGAMAAARAPKYETKHAPAWLMEEAAKLWDPHEADRFAKLALAYPDLLNYDEGILWKLIQECPAVWEDTSKKRLNFKLLREHWETFQAVAAGTADPETLPKEPGNG